MADAVLFEFLHMEMVAELWAHEPDPDPGPGVSAGPQGEEARAAAGSRIEAWRSAVGAAAVRDEPRACPCLAGRPGALASSSVE